MSGRCSPDVVSGGFRRRIIDYYVATPLGRRLLAAGPLGAVHKYWWINQRREPLEAWG